MGSFSLMSQYDTIYMLKLKTIFVLDVQKSSGSVRTGHSTVVTLFNNCDLVQSVGPLSLNVTPCNLKSILHVSSHLQIAYSQSSVLL